jgi:WD40 repeat protein
MNDQPPLNDPVLSLSIVQRVNEACDRFEAAWKTAQATGQRPRIEDYLGDAPEPERFRLLRELIALDTYYRRLAGEGPKPEDYHARFPSVDLAPFASAFSPLLVPDRSARTGPGMVVQTHPPSAEIVAAGVRIPGYEILSELGRGGMGVVYLARQRGLDRLVALKMSLAGAHASPEDVARFRREAEAVAQLQHPHIVQVYEVGEHEGRPYFSLEYVEGGSLAQKLAGTPLPAPQAAQLVEVLAGAIHAAHQRDIIHRDLKPANVLLTANGTPKITDFGLAKRLDAPAGLTQSGAIVGTPSYMAPEQAGGPRKAVGPAVDVYALGAVLYEALTGRPPFRAETPLDTVLQVLSEEPVPPRRLLPKIPRDLETICLKCLQKEPQRRYTSAEALAADLKRWLTGEPILARSSTAWERSVKWAKRRPAAAALLAVSGLAVVAVVAVLAISNVLITEKQRQTVKALGERDEALESLQREQQETRLAFDRERQTSYFQRISLADGEWQAGHIARAEQILDECEPELRQWEWHYLKRRIHTEILALPGHTGPVTSVAFSPDGKRVATGSGRPDIRGEVKIWDATTGRELLTLRGHTRGVNSVAFSLDGKRLASGSEDATVRVWDATTGEKLLTLHGHVDRVTSVAFGPQGLASASSEGSVMLWNMNGKKLRTFLGPRGGWSYSVALSPDGKRLASAYSRTVKIWDVASGKELPDLDGLGHRVAFSPDGKRLAAGRSKEDTAEVVLLDAISGQELLALRGLTGYVTSLAFSPDGKRLVATTSSALLWGVVLSGIKVWDTTTARELFTLRGAGGCLAFSPDGKSLAVTATGGDDRPTGEARIWDATASQEALTLPTLFLGDSTVVFSPDGKRLAVTGDGPKVFDVTTGQEIFNLGGSIIARGLPGLKRTRGEGTRGHMKRVTSVVFSADGTRLTSTSLDNTLKVWDASTGKELHTVPIRAGGTWITAFNPDGKRIAEAAQGRVIVRDVSTGEEVLTLPHQGQSIRTLLTFSHDGQRLAAGTAPDNAVRVWDAATGKELLTLQGHAKRVTSVAFSPDGQRLASGSGDQTVRIWDTATGKELLALRGHADVVSCVAFSHDGKRLASASSDRTVKIWEATTGRDILTLRGYTDPVQGVAFSPDGTRLASWDRAVKIWDTTTASGKRAPPDWHEQALAVVESHPAERAKSQNILKSIGIAMHAYHDVYGKFPPAVGYGPDGKTPHSWRVLLLPYLESETLYRQYNFREPWDSPNNRKLLAKMPAYYRHPMAAADSTDASYFVVTGPTTVFSGKEGTPSRDLTAGTSATILAVEAKRAIPWTKPEDIPYDPGQPFPEFGGYFPDGFYVVKADGSVGFLSGPRPDEKVLGRMFTKKGLLSP